MQRIEMKTGTAKVAKLLDIIHAVLYAPSAVLWLLE